MDWTPVIAALATGAASFWVILKGVVPRIVDARLAEANAEREAERQDREAKIRSEAERDAYDRNRAATREDRQLELLHETLEWLKEQAEKDWEQKERMIEALSRQGHEIYRNGNNTMTLAQQAAVTNDGINELRVQVASIANVLIDRNGRGRGDE